MNTIHLYGRINELAKRCIGGLDGKLDDLLTTEKGNLISAINEIKIITNLLQSEASVSLADPEGHTEETSNEDGQPVLLDVWSDTAKDSYIQSVTFTYDSIGRVLTLIVRDYDGSDVDAGSSVLVRTVTAVYDYSGEKETKTVVWS